VNKVGVHALVWTAGWTERDCRHAIESTRSAGYDLIEIPLLDPGAVDPELTARVLAEYEMEAACSLGLRFDADISSPDADVHARGRKLLHDALAVSRDLGARYLGGALYSALGKYLEAATPAGRANCVAGLAELSEAAAAAGITLGLEPVNRYESNLVNTAADAVALIKDIGSSNIVVHLDTYHMNIEEADLSSAVEAASDYLGYVHVGENHRGYLGSGSIDFQTFFRALHAARYEGIITFEAFSSAVVSETFAAALGLWRRTWEDSFDLASRALSFIDAQVSLAALTAGAEL
jgi:D-psicose/D-tagatose/L-ribulose 3-epimerase